MLHIHELINLIFKTTQIQKIEFNKVEAHKGVALNERADSIANKYRAAAKWPVSAAPQWTSRTAISYVKRRTKKVWEEEYKTECITEQTERPHRYNYIRTFVQKPNKRFKRLFLKLNREQTHYDACADKQITIEHLLLIDRDQHGSEIR